MTGVESPLVLNPFVVGKNVGEDPHTHSRTHTYSPLHPGRLEKFLSIASLATYTSFLPPPSSVAQLQEN